MLLPGCVVKNRIVFHSTGALLLSGLHHQSYVVLEVVLTISICGPSLSFPDHQHLTRSREPSVAASSTTHKALNARTDSV